MIYHKNSGFPDTLVIPEVILSLGYTTHAKQRKEKDYKLLVTPTVVKITKDNVVEASTDDKVNLTKVLIRIPYMQGQDMVLAIKPNFKKNTGTVITLWVNRKNDQHKNLKKKYDLP